jgi:hypothetical protein
MAFTLGIAPSSHSEPPVTDLYQGTASAVPSLVFGAPGALARGMASNARLVFDFSFRSCCPNILHLIHMPTSVLFTLALTLLVPLPAFAQTSYKPATLIIVDSRDRGLWDYKLRYYDETGKEVATAKGCQIVRLTLTPGQHKFWSNKDKKKTITLNAVAGETYYAAGGLKLQLPTTMWFEFDLVTRADAESWVKKCNLPPSSLDPEPHRAEQHH